MHSCLYRGTIRHRRFRPRPHAFSYSLYMLYLDLAEVNDVFRGRWLWSTSRPAVAWFRRQDHVGPPEQRLDETIRDLVYLELGLRPNGPIRLLTHLRYFGFLMSPVAFYFCFDEADDEPLAVVAEVHNTPWNERHCYVLGRETIAGVDGFETTKEFHVSPFLPMDMRYHWHIRHSGNRVTVAIQNWREDEHTFEALLHLEKRPISNRSLAWALVNFPLMTHKVFLGIYWQALLLWWKGLRVYPHPSTRLAGRRGAN